MVTPSVFIEWSELFIASLDDDLIDLWTVAAHQLQVDAQALSRTAKGFQETHHDQALRIVDVVSEVDAVHDVDVAATIMAITQTHDLDEWAPTIRHDPEKVALLQKLHAAGIHIGIISESVWSRNWVHQFLDRDHVAYDKLIIANEGNWRLHFPDAWEDAVTHLGPGEVICSDERKASGAIQINLRIRSWLWVHTQAKVISDLTPYAENS
ncbi:hypothetical protein [Stomatohabitans albus]|uniref:hypothetical protein n=1 Tax=Stomatohabitans albus TaxID=3110766 RepID=UPI00300D4442